MITPTIIMIATVVLLGVAEMLDWRRHRALDRRVEELERIVVRGGCVHQWKLAWASESGRYIERCQKPGCNAWRGSI